MSGAPAVLADAAHLYRELFEHASELVVVTRRDGIVVDVNPAVEAVTGYRRDEIQGRPYTLFVDESTLAADVERFESVVAEQLPPGVNETVVRTRDGRLVTLLANGWPIVSGGEVEGILTIAWERSARPADELAHELNNLLAVVAGNAELALRSADDRLRPRLEEILSAARRGAQLARRLLI